MKHIHYSDVPAEAVEQDASGVSIRWLITEKDSAPNFVMRHFEITPGGHTPLHSHAWEHEVYILEGAGTVTGSSGDEPFRTGDVIFMPPAEEHQFKNTGPATVKMLCLIPARK